MASHKERVWLEEYFKCWNATEAARRSGYSWPNKIGPAKLAKFEAEIEQRIQEKALSTDEALAFLADQARFDPGLYLVVVRDEETGIVTDIGVDVERLRRDGMTHILKSITPTRSGYRFEFYDKQAAINMILRAAGAYTDNLDVTSGGKSLMDVEAWKAERQARLNQVGQMPDPGGDAGNAAQDT